MVMPPVLNSADVQAMVRRLESFVRRQKWFVIVVSTVVIGVSAVLAWVSPPIYTAKATFVVERTRNPLLRDRVERPLPSLEADKNVRTLIVSRPVIGAVVDQLRPDAETSSESAGFDPWGAITERLNDWGLVTRFPPRERYVNQWSRRLIVETQGDLVEIRFTHPNRRVATEVTNLVVKEFVKRYLALYNTGKIAALRNELVQSLGSEITAVRAVASQATSSGSAARLALADRIRVLRLWSRDVDASIRSLQSTVVAGHPRLAADLELSSALAEAIAEGEAALRRVESANTEAHERDGVLRNLRITFNATAQAAEQLRLAQHADARTVNIRIVELAEVPSVPDGDRLLRILMALLATPVFAIAAAILRDNLVPHAAGNALS
jgi:uncharacterized protein involved in exopolysaccharide biosynthesis